MHYINNIINFEPDIEYNKSDELLTYMLILGILKKLKKKKYRKLQLPQLQKNTSEKIYDYKEVFNGYNSACDNFIKLIQIFENYLSESYSKNIDWKYLKDVPKYNELSYVLPVSIKTFKIIDMVFEMHNMIIGYTERLLKTGHKLVEATQLPVMRGGTLQDGIKKITDIISLLKKRHQKFIFSDIPDKEQNIKFKATNYFTEKNAKELLDEFTPSAIDQNISLNISSYNAFEYKINPYSQWQEDINILMNFVNIGYTNASSAIQKINNIMKLYNEQYKFNIGTQPHIITEITKDKYNITDEEKKQIFKIENDKDTFVNKYKQRQFIIQTQIMNDISKLKKDYMDIEEKKNKLHIINANNQKILDTPSKIPVKLLEYNKILFSKYVGKMTYASFWKKYTTVLKINALSNEKMCEILESIPRIYDQQSYIDACHQLQHPTIETYNGFKSFFDMIIKKLSDNITKYENENSGNREIRNTHRSIILQIREQLPIITDEDIEIYNLMQKHNTEIQTIKTLTEKNDTLINNITRAKIEVEKNLAKKSIEKNTTTLQKHDEELRINNEQREILFTQLKDNFISANKNIADYINIQNNNVNDIIPHFYKITSEDSEKKNIFIYRNKTVTNIKPIEPSGVDIQKIFDEYKTLDPKNVNKINHIKNIISSKSLNIMNNIVNTDEEKLQLITFDPTDFTADSRIQIALKYITDEKVYKYEMQLYIYLQAYNLLHDKKYQQYLTIHEAVNRLILLQTNIPKNSNLILVYAKQERCYIELIKNLRKENSIYDCESENQFDLLFGFEEKK